MSLCYTNHAWERVHGRLYLTPAEVVDILEGGLAIDIGTEQGTDRVHRLFYSIPDQMCFVAVEDYVDGVLITILPIDYHDRIAWRVSEDAQRAARRLVLATPQQAQDRNAAVDERPTVFRLVAYSHEPDGRVIVLNLGSWPCAPYHGLTERLLEDDAFCEAVAHRITTKGRDVSECEALYVRRGNAPPTRVSPTHFYGTTTCRTEPTLEACAEAIGC